MLLPWRWREVLLTQEVSRYAHAKQALSSAGIDFRARTVSHNSSGRARSPLGSAGVRMEYRYFYYLYVRPQDFEHARHILP